jgi:nitric oxide reductase activation protein
MREMLPLPESRKIIFVVTDGEPDSFEEAKAAIEVAKKLRLELFGLGLGDHSINKLLPQRSAVLINLTDLPQKLFWLLGQAINNKPNRR